MNAALKQSTVRGEVRMNEPMSRHTVWACGGPADYFYKPADLSDLCHYLRQLAPTESMFWLGLGSNLLVRDGGLRSHVVALAGAIDGIEIVANKVLVMAGTACAKVARACANAKLRGATFLAGIPGTMGGALAMNAGAFGGETWPIVVRVQTIDRQGRLRWRAARDFDYGYRTVRGPRQEWFVGCELQLDNADTTSVVDAREEIKALLAKRASSQPTGQRSCGSVFRNPENDFAGRLIELAGLKGMRVGGAVVSIKHANFIINDEDASAADIEALITHVQNAVMKNSGTRLVCEVQIVGEI